MPPTRPTGRTALVPEIASASPVAVRFAREPLRERDLAGERIDFVIEGIGHVLTDRKLKVPIFQRSFKWRLDEIGEYWDDLSEAMTADDPEYFLGTLVLTRSEGEDRWTVIDGQQRLATTSILIAGIRDVYRIQGEEKVASEIHRAYLASFNISDKSEAPHLYLNTDDNPFFQSTIVGDQGIRSAVDPTRVSHGYIAEADALLQEKLQAGVENSGGNWEKYLVGWLKFLESNTRVVVVGVPDESDAYLIFETLNDRGADLTIEDLLKNFLFGRAGSRLDEVRDAWVVSQNALDSTGDAALFTMFLRHHWSSLRGATRERDLYRSIRDQVANEAQTVDFVDDMQRAANLYAALLSSTHEFWSDMGKSTRDNVETLLRLRLEQNRPMLLAAMSHFSEDDLKEVLRRAISWLVRGLVVGGIGAGSTEKAYSNAAVKIRRGEIKTADGLFDSLSSIIPTDAEFHTALLTTRVTRGPIARYYLVALEGQEIGKDEPELVPNEDEEKVNLEHILPKSPKKGDWDPFDDDEKGDYLHRLGNLALLSKGPNGKIGNKPFSEKKPVLEASELTLTKQAGAAVDWTPEAVAERQEQLADLALAVWPRYGTGNG